MIEKGTADVSHDGEPFATLGRGDFFGEIGLLVAERRTASVVATSPMRLIVLTGSQFRVIERIMPSVAAQIRAAVESRLVGRPFRGRVKQRLKAVPARG